MERGLILLVAAVLVSVAPFVHGTFHLSFNSSLPVNISRDGCGKTKLCISTPMDCDPANSSSCLFASFDVVENSNANSNASGTNSTMNGTTSGTNGTMNGTTSGTNGTMNGTSSGSMAIIRDVDVELSGESEGFIAVGRTMNISQGVSMVFICGRNASNNNSFFFRTMERDNTNNMLTPMEQLVSQIRAELNESLIQCEFRILRLNITNPAVLFLATGSVNSSMLGPLNISLVTSPLDINDPASNVPTTAPPTTSTTAPPTTSSAAPPTTSSAAPPTTSSAAPPTTSTTAPPTTSITAPPTTSSAAPPTTSSAAPPTTSTTAPPTTSITAPPTTSSAAPPTTSSAAPPTTSTTAPPTTSTTAPPTTSSAAGVTPTHALLLLGNMVTLLALLKL